MTEQSTVKEWATYRRLDHLGIELLDARFVTHTFMPHSHDGFALGVIRAGAEQYRYRGTQITAANGSVVLIPPSEIHTGQSAHPAGWTYRMAYFDPRWLVEAQQALGRRGVPGFRSSVLLHPALTRTLEHALQALEDGRDALRAETLWREALESLAGQFSEHPAMFRAAGREHRAVAEARALLEAEVALERPQSSLDLSGLALAVGLTPTGLSRSFRAELGLPPHAYRLNLRVQQARRLLVQGEPLAEVALRLGFVDQAHLSRVFKRIVGVPPGHFQRSARNVQDLELLRH